MKTTELHMLGVNHHQTGVELYIGTEDELFDIASAGGTIVKISPEDAADPDSHWPDGPGWYYSIGDREYTKEETRFACIASILQHDGHPLSFTVEQGLKIIRRDAAGEDTGLWHHNRSKVISAIRRCLEERDLLPMTDTLKTTPHTTKYTTSGMRSVHADTMREAAAIFATRMARRSYGRSGYCRTLMQQAAAQNGSLAEYRAFIGYTPAGKHNAGSTVGHNVHFTVYAA